MIAASAVRIMVSVSLNASLDVPRSQTSCSPGGGRVSKVTHQSLDLFSPVQGKVWGCRQWFTLQSRVRVATYMGPHCHLCHLHRGCMSFRQLKCSVIELTEGFGLLWILLLRKILPTLLGSLLSTQEPGGDGIDWGDDAAALQITVLEAGTQGKCTIACSPGRSGCSQAPVSLETKNALLSLWTSCTFNCLRKILMRV